MDLLKIVAMAQDYVPNERVFLPFKLTFRLQSPVALAHPWLHLDGIIAHLLLRKILGTKLYLLPAKLPLDFFSVLKLPLKTTKRSDKTLYHASISFFDYSSLFATVIYKRFDDKHVFLLKKIPKKIERNRGQYKDYAMKLPYIPATKIHFYGNGDVTEIKELLKLLPGLGKKVSIGYGFINSFNIKPIKSDFSVLNKTGVTMKPIPVEFVENNISVEKVVLGYKFPYWGKQNICLCVPPGEKIITLKKGV